MRFPSYYAMFCLAVLVLFTYAQSRGLAAFGWLAASSASSSRSAGGGFVSRGSGGFSGSHK